MQKVEFNGAEYCLPDHHEGDRDWLISMLYYVKARTFEPVTPLTEPQRAARIAAYDAEYNAIIDKFTVNGVQHHSADSVARREANTNLRQRIDAIRSMRQCAPTGINALIIEAKK